jgi:hypothetical protein
MKWEQVKWLVASCSARLRRLDEKADPHGGTRTVCPRDACFHDLRPIQATGPVSKTLAATNRTSGGRRDRETTSKRVPLRKALVFATCGLSFLATGCLHPKLGPNSLPRDRSLYSVSLADSW